MSGLPKYDCVDGHVQKKFKLRLRPLCLLLALSVSFFPLMMITTTVSAHGIVSSDIDKFRVVLSLNPEDFDTRKSLIHALRDTRQYGEALAELAFLRTQTPDDISLDFEGAFVAFEQQDFVLANRFIDAFLRNAVTDERGHTLSGHIKMELGDFKGAAKAFGQALQQRQITDTYLYQAQAYDAMGDRKAAIQSLQSGIANVGPLPLFYIRIVDYQRSLGDYRQAIQTLEQLIARLGEDARSEQYVAQKGDLLMQAGQPQQAYIAYKKAQTQLMSRSARIRSLASSKALDNQINSKLRLLKQQQ